MRGGLTWPIIQKLIDDSGLLDIDPMATTESLVGPYCVVYTRGGQPAGFISWSDIKDDGWVEVMGLVVAKPWQRTGLAFKMVKDMLAFLKSKGVDRIAFQVCKDNEKMWGYAEKVGCQSYDEQGNYRVYKLDLTKEK